MEKVNGNRKEVHSFLDNLKGFRMTKRCDEEMMEKKRLSTFLLQLLFGTLTFLVGKFNDFPIE